MKISFSAPLAIAVATCLWIGRETTQAQSIYEPLTFSTLAGSALTSGADDNTGSLARFNQPWGVAVDDAGSLYIADTLNHTIRKVTPGGVTTSIAGIAGSAGFADGATGTAQFSRPTGVAVNGAGTIIYVADYNNHLIRQISGGTVSTVAGTVGALGVDDGVGTAAKFRNPFGVALNSAETVLYVADQNNQTIRAIDLSSGTVTTFAGTPNTTGSTDGANLSATFNTPRGIAVDANDNVYVADAGNFTVRKISAGNVITLAGLAANFGFDDGIGNAARFSRLQAMSPFGGPCGIAVDGSGNVFVTDQGNHTIRKITAAGSVTTLAGLAQTSGSADGTGNAAGFNFPSGIVMDSTGSLYVVDTANHTIRYQTETTNTEPCLIITCPTNKTVVCGTAWEFDLPTATSCCRNAAGPAPVTLSILSTETNGLACAQTITRTWQATDACGNTNTCSQTVTLVDDVAPVFECASSSDTEFSLGTLTDDFDGIEPSYISAGLLQRLQAAGVISYKGFDECTVNSFFAHTFTNLPPCITGATLHVRFRACGSNLNDNDTFGLSFTGPTGEVAASSWGRYLGNGNGAAGLFNTGWDGGTIQEITLDLSQLPNADGTTTDLLAALSVQGFLDIVLQDDTSIDFAVLTIAGCCDTSPKTVECGSDWSFDEPIATDACSGTNVTVSVLSTVSDGTCPQVITRTWVATDLCGNTNTFSQSVTVVDTTPPTLVCATNKTVLCGSRWDFDTPLASDNCGGGAAGGSSSVIVSILSTETNGVACAQNITRTWLATDTCGNTNTCSQTVTLVDDIPPVFACSVSPITEFAIGTLTDDFDGSEPSFINPGLLERLQKAGITSFKGFDDCTIDSYFAHTFTNLPACITSATLRVRFQACGSALNGNDSFGLSFTDSTGEVVAPGWGRFLGNGNGSAGLFNTNWDGGTIQEITLDLSQLPNADGTTTDLLAALSAQGFLDIVLQDDSSIDFAVLTITGCCDTRPKTVECGSDWSFDVPVATDNCSGTNVTVSVLSTVTDGTCPQVITRTWVATDLCGNTNTFSQSVTVVDTTPPTLVCATNKTVLCGSRWEFDTPLASDNCGGGAAGGSSSVIISILSTETNGVACAQTITRTWLATDACGNTNTCSQTVTVVDNEGPILTCAEDKAVDCGKPWSFDEPTAVDACSEKDVILAVLNTVTNRVACPQTITRTWVATDACGNTNTCSQTITLQDDVPPTITCPDERIIVALDKNCDLVIPAMRPKVSDNCTPRKDLIWTQDPPAGTIISKPSQVVTLIVRDACGNASQCQVTVIGQDKTPPVIEHPKTVEVVDCVVPDITTQIRVWDDCMAFDRLVITQSPAAGTPIAAGGNQVTITATDAAGNTTTVVVPLDFSGPQSFLGNLFNTGVDASYAVLPNTSVDPHYTLGPVPAGISTGVGGYNAPDAIVYNPGFSLPPFTVSSWILPYLGGDFPPAGTYVYTNRFMLPPGADPSAASISGRWSAATSLAQMYLNGSPTPLSSMTFPGFNQWTSFTINGGLLAHPAVNEVRFVVQSPDRTSTGLRVEFTSAVINCVTCAPPVVLYTTPDQSRPRFGTAVFSANVWGTPPMTYQWHRNGDPLVNGGHYSGVDTPTLTITPLGYADAGEYRLHVSNACGETSTRGRKLTVTKGWKPWDWWWWNFEVIDRPLTGVLGPDLVLNSDKPIGLSSGSTVDFGLPNLGGKLVNVLHVPSLPRDTFLKLPLTELPGSNRLDSFTLLLDVYAPSNQTERSTLFDIFDRWGNLQGACIVVSSNVIHLGLTGTIGSAPVNLTSMAKLRLGQWNRIAFRLDASATNVAYELYLNGGPGDIDGDGNYDMESPMVDPMISVLSSPEGTMSDMYAACIQFHAFAMTPEMIASLGSPDSGPLPGNNTSVSETPILSARMEGGVIVGDWQGDGFKLQETSDLGSGRWTDSEVPFEMVETGDTPTTSARIKVMPGNNAKFYRLIYAP